MFLCVCVSEGCSDVGAWLFLGLGYVGREKNRERDRVCDGLIFHACVR